MCMPHTFECVFSLRVIINSHMTEVSWGSHREPTTISYVMTDLVTKHYSSSCATWSIPLIKRHRCGHAWVWVHHLWQRCYFQFIKNWKFSWSLRDLFLQCWWKIKAILQSNPLFIQINYFVELTSSILSTSFGVRS